GRRAEHPILLDVPPLALEQRVARGGQPGEVGHGGAGDEASARGGRQPERVDDPPDADLFESGAHRGGRARARILIPGAGEPVRGQGGRKGAPVHEAEVAASGVHHRGRRGDLVEERHDGGRIGRAVRQRSAQLLEPRDGGRRGGDAAAREALEVAGGAVSGLAQEVVHGGGSFPVVGSRTGTHLYPNRPRRPRANARIGLARAPGGDYRTKVAWRAVSMERSTSLWSKTWCARSSSSSWRSVVLRR